MPKSKKLLGKNGRCKLCIHHLLGRCSDITCQKVHVPGTALENEYVEETVNKLEAGINKLVLEGGMEREREAMAEDDTTYQWWRMWTI